MDILWITLPWISCFCLDICFISPGYIPRCRIAGSYGNSAFNFLSCCQTVPKWLPHFTFLLAMHEGSKFSTFSPTVVNICPGWSKAISHCGVDLHFPDNKWCWTSFHERTGHLFIFFGELFMIPFYLLCGLLGVNLCIINLVVILGFIVYIFNYHCLPSSDVLSLHVYSRTLHKYTSIFPPPTFVLLLSHLWLEQMVSSL